MEQLEKIINGKVWEQKLVELPLVQGRQQQYQVTAKSYINLCNGTIKENAKVADEDQVWTISHTLTVVTSNFKGLKKLEAAANKYTQEQRKSAGSSRVEIHMDCYFT